MHFFHESSRALHVDSKDDLLFLANGLISLESPSAPIPGDEVAKDQGTGMVCRRE